MKDGRCLSKITQGITTEIMGEAWTPAPVGADSALASGIPEDWKDRARSWHRFGSWLDAMVEAGVSPNLGSFLGGEPSDRLRWACGWESRHPTR